MTLKRSREEVAAGAEAMAMANCLVLLSHRPSQTDNKTAPSLGWEFECKTCKKKFKSFQALGGHRASHKRPKPDPQDLKDNIVNLKKKHECSVCGLEFALGQALGGHMRKHRADQQHNSEDNNKKSAKSADLLAAVKNEEEEDKKKKVVLFGIDLLNFTTPLEDDSMVDRRFVVDIPRTTLDLFV